MTLRARFTSGKRVVVLFVALFTTLVAIGGLLVFSLRAIESDRLEQHTRARRRHEIIDEVAKNAGLAQNEVLRHLLAADVGERDRAEHRFRELDALTGRILAAFGRAADAASAGGVDGRLGRALEGYRDSTSRLLALSRTGSPPEAVASATSAQQLAFLEFDAAVDATGAVADREIRDLGEATTAFISKIRTLGNTLVGLAIAFALAIGLAVPGIARRLRVDNARLKAGALEQELGAATLRESEAKFRQIAEGISDVFWTTSPDMRTMHYVSPAYERIWGRSTQSLYAQAHEWIDAIIPEDRERAVAVFGTLIGGAAEVSVEYRIARPDGTIRWVHDRGFEVRDAAGVVRSFTGIVADITERKRIEGILERQTAELRVLFDLIPAMIWFKDVENRILRINRRAADAAGLAVEAIEGRPSAEVYPKDAARFYADDLQVIRSGVPKLGFIETLGGPAGAELWVRTDKVPYFGADGKVIGIVVLAQDISERRRAEERLRLLGAAVEQSKESILITDAQIDPPGPKIVFVNPAFTKMTGYAAAEVLGSTPRVLQGPRTDRLVLDRLRACLVRGETFDGEAVNYRKDGTTFELEWTITPLRDPSGTITHFVAIQRDVTARKRLEAQAVQSQRLETVGRLAGGIAHEFNSILTAIIGQSELMLGELPSASPLAHAATEVREAAGRAAVLTRQLLAYGRKQVLRPELLDLNRLVAGMDRMLLHLMPRDVDVRFTPNAGLGAVMADAGQLEQVIVNLAMNAADAMPNGGTLTIECANVTLDAAYVSRFADLRAGEFVMLAVTDSGGGMSEEVRARVFEPFFSTKAVGEGTGLGLSTCYGIVKQSGGHIGVYSEVGRGSTFKVYLPRVSPTGCDDVDRVDSPDWPRGAETILLVEDDASLREMEATLLRRLGYQVLAAADGLEALRIKQRPGVGHVDLLLTDVVMPHMGGRELADRVRGSHPQTRVLFTSAYTESAVVHQGAMDVGVSLLPKPFTPAMLACRVREVLDRAPA